MKIAVLGDVHGDLKTVEEIIGGESPDYVLCTGDLQKYRDFEVPFFFVHGNHEDFDQIEEMKEENIYRNLNLINPGEVVNLENLRIAGLSGNYSPKRYQLDRSSLHQDRRRHFVKEDVEKCKDLEDIDLFLSHEAPSGIGVKKRKKEQGVEPVGEILEVLKPRYWFFGHVHLDFWKKQQKTEVVGLDYSWKSYVVLFARKGGIKAFRRTGPHPVKVEHHPDSEKEGGF